MPDTILIGTSIENYVAYKLYKWDILVAKPYFDRNGADLLALRKVDREAKFIRIQSKGRTIKGNHTSSLEIPKSYVDKDFVVFLHIEIERIDDENEIYLYCYFTDDITKWDCDKDNYKLYIPNKFYEKDSFKVCLFNKEKAHKIIEIIENANVEESFDKYINNFDGMLESCISMWKKANILPDTDILEVLAEKLDFNQTNLYQNEFLFYSAFYKHDALSEKNWNASLEFLFHYIAAENNLEESIFSKYVLKRIKYSNSMFSDWYICYRKYSIASIVLECNGLDLEGLYCFCRDSEGEGIEYFICKENRQFSCVRHIQYNAKNEHIKVIKLIEEFNTYE